MKWVACENAGVDRTASAWLTLRVNDPQAEFGLISVGERLLPEGAEPFDIPGVCCSHRLGHCIFQALLGEYTLRDPLSEHLAQIMDRADVDQEAAAEPAYPCLDLTCRCLHHTSADHFEAIECGGLIHEALQAELATSQDVAV